MKAAAFLGNPDGRRTPTSVVVPPTSTTITDFFVFSSVEGLLLSSPARNDAPLMEFVGPFENVLMGIETAIDAGTSVPSN